MRVCSILAVSFAICAANAVAENKIVGGTADSIANHPFQVSILNERNNLLCGGSIIGSYFVLTSAACLYQNVRRFVRSGSIKAEQGGTLHNVVQKVIHPDFVNNKYDWKNDVGLIMVQERFIWNDYTKQIRLAADPIYLDGKLVEITGFGTISANGPNSEFLMAVKVPIVNRRKCDFAYMNLGMNEITENRFCAGAENGGKDACSADSGGPVVYGSLQVGIISYGYGCGLAEFPGIYTNVSFYYDWILKNVGILSLNQKSIGIEYS